MKIYERAAANSLEYGSKAAISPLLRSMATSGRMRNLMAQFWRTALFEERAAWLERLIFGRIPVYP